MAAAIQSPQTLDQVSLTPRDTMITFSGPSLSEASSPRNMPLDGGRPSGPLTRVWEPPPRPKPGRKPATDTPPSKRKAQNRQAQRNFRERRAQKISELESLMEEDRRASGSTIEKLNAELVHYQTLYEEIKKQLHRAQTDLTREKEARIAAQEEAERTKAVLLEEKGVVPLRPRAKLKTSPVENVLDTMVLGLSRQSQDLSAAAACGRKCKPEKCACVDEIIEAGMIDSQILVTQDSMSPAVASTTDQFGRTDAPAHLDIEMEIDMTTRPKMTQRQLSTSTAGSSHLLTAQTPDFEDGNCGFCNNSSVCPCRDFQSNTVRDQSDPSRAQIQRQTQYADQTQQASRGCSGNPGSCSQCQRDPMSKDFCVSFAKQIQPLQARAPEKHSVASSCGATDCCRVSPQQQPNHMRAVSMPASGPTHLTPQLGGDSDGSSMDCASAYNQLKTHPHFSEAMANKEKWMRKLRPIPSSSTPLACDIRYCALPASTPLKHEESAQVTTPCVEGMSAYEIDAASVIATFRYFDRKFGTDSHGDWKKEENSRN